MRDRKQNCCKINQNYPRRKKKNVKTKIVRVFFEENKIKNGDKKERMWCTRTKKNANEENFTFHSFTLFQQLYCLVLLVTTTFHNEGIFAIAEYIFFHYP